MSICKMLTLSTGHLTPATCAWLDDWAKKIDLTRKDYGECPVYIGVTDLGWMVHAQEGEREGVPDDLKACQDHARSLDCDYLLFDADCDDVEALPLLGGPDGSATEDIRF